MPALGVPLCLTLVAGETDETRAAPSTARGQSGQSQGPQDYSSFRLTIPAHSAAPGISNFLQLVSSVLPRDSVRQSGTPESWQNDHIGEGP
jgi:hypothetical protein